MAAKNGDRLSRSGSDGGQVYLPTTRYYGSKRRQVAWLSRRLGLYEFQTVLDAFGGTGTVSLLLAHQGKTVSYHDSLHFNCSSARALLTPYPDGISRDWFESVLLSIRPRSGFISKAYDGVFYTGMENRWLDGALHALNESRIEGLSEDVFNYCLFQACLQKRPYNMFHRANLGMRVAKGVSRSFGNLTTWETPFRHLMLRAFDELHLARKNTPAAATVMSPGPVTQIEPGYDLVYLDPPYLRARIPESYLRRYHFLEGLARREIWPSLIDKGTRCNFFRKGYLSEDWENPREIKERLESLVELHSKSIVALSYMDNGVPSVPEIKRIFSRHFSKTSVFRTPVNYALSRSQNTEVLIIGRNC